MTRSGQAVRGAAAGKLTVKSCGKAHAYCNICKPDRRPPSGRPPPATAETKELRAATIISRGSLAGENNPRWRGGSNNGYGSGWKAARRAVWARDLVCRACGEPPLSNRSLDVHHIVGRRVGGTHDLSNLVGLHHSCHMRVEAGTMNIQGSVE